MCDPEILIFDGQLRLHGSLNQARLIPQIGDKLDGVCAQIFVIYKRNLLALLPFQEWEVERARNQSSQSLALWCQLHILGRDYGNRPRIGGGVLWLRQPDCEGLAIAAMRLRRVIVVWYSVEPEGGSTMRGWPST